MDYKGDIILWDEVSELFKPGADNLEARIKTEKTTRKNRIKAAFEASSKTNFSGRIRQVFDLMWLGKDIESLNGELLEDLYEELDLLQKEETDKSIQPKYGHYCLSRSLILISFYYCFGSKGTLASGRLEAKTEEVLLEVLWERTKYKNDIAVTRNSTWWVTGSENHDFNTKACNLMSSRIFMEEEGYKNKIYPNLGYGDGIDYGDAGDFSRQEAYDLHAGRANESDGIDYKPGQHYEAWKQYMMTYFRERAKKGFFLENASNGYMKWTISFMLGLYNYCGSEELKDQIGQFFDLFWADWAAQQIGGLRGGPKTRHHYEVGGYDSMTEWARFYAGGSGKTTFNYVQQLISDYEWPNVIWEMIYDRNDATEYEYISRGIGEENPIFPRPKGVERTMLGDVESRFVKYAYVTPDYILGTQMDHPYAYFNHLAISGRWQGLVTADPDVRIATVTLDPVPGAYREGKDYSLELMYNSVQHKNVLITQQRRRWNQINPDWYPAYADKYYDRPFGLHVGGGWDQVRETEGWVFLLKDKTYVAIKILQVETNKDPLAWAKGTDKYKNRIVLTKKAYTWDSKKTILRFKDKFSPAIIEAGRQEAYGSFDIFVDRILANTLKVYKTVVTDSSAFVIAYKGCSKDAKEIVYNSANTDDAATIGGDYIDYYYPKVFDCPYIQSDYNSGVVKLTSSSNELILDFTKGNDMTPTRINPLLPIDWELYIADGEPHVYDGYLYLYGSMDMKNGIQDGEAFWCSTQYHVIRTKDLINWEDMGTSFSFSDIPKDYLPDTAKRLWAPDVCYNPGDGRYYLYLCTNGKGGIFVASSDNPWGPFVDPKPLTIDGDDTFPKVIDPGVLLDDDGKAYIVWPGRDDKPWAIGQLDPEDFSNVLGETITPIEGLLFPFEGPSLRKRGDTYYFIYIQNNGPWTEDNIQPTRMAYMTSQSPLGPYTYQGLIIESSDYPGAINIHGSITEWEGQWYVFYHLPAQGMELTRYACAVPIEFDSEGRIIQGKLMSCGPRPVFELGEVIPAYTAVDFSGGVSEIRCDFNAPEDAYLFFDRLGSYAGYRYVDFEQDACTGISVRARSEVACVLELRSDEANGQLLARIPIEKSHDYIDYHSKAVSGISHRHAVYIKLVEKNGEGLVKVSSFTLRKNGF